MRKFHNTAIATFILALLTITVSAQIPDIMQPGEQFEFRPHYHKSSPVNEIQKLQSYLSVRPYDVLSYDIYLDWYGILTAPGETGDFRRYTGYNNIKVKIDSNNINQLTFDAVNLIIDSVISEENYKLKVTQVSENFKVDLLSTKFSGDLVTLKVYFTYIGKENGGLYLFPKGLYVGQGPPPKRDSVFVLERLAYTMAEPQDARKWLPCNDAPYDKAMVTLKVLVPTGFAVASNGLLDSAVAVNGKTLFHFTSKHPMTTYLITVNASKFSYYSSKYFRVTNPLEEVPIEYFVWEEDWTSDTTNGGAYNAQFSFRNLPKMMENYSKIFGEYPFEKYGMVAVQPFGFGGMEHQTMSTINRSWMRGYSETGIAHELAHQWLGDKITCATWADIWINEGGATWSEALWLESLYGKETYYQYMNQVASRYRNEEALYEIPILGVPISSIFSHPIYLLEYNKASWVYHMLREQLGDSLFFGALNNLLDEYAYQSIESIDFMNSFKQYIPDSDLDFDIFFDQWLAKAGHPKFKMHTITYDWGSGKSKVKINLQQTQTGSKVPTTFVSMIEFQFFIDSVLTDTKTELLYTNDQDFEFYLPFYPDSVSINTNKVLCDFEENLLSVRSLENNVKSAGIITPNPIRKGDNGKFNLAVEGQKFFEIQLFDAYGRKIETIFTGTLPKGNYEISIPTGNLSSGAYIVNILENSHLKILKLMVAD